MSLMHDALKSVDAEGPAVALPPGPAPVSAAAKPAQGWLGGLAAFVVVVGAGGGAYWLWQGSQPGAHQFAASGAAAVPALAAAAPPVVAPMPASAPVYLPTVALAPSADSSLPPAPEGKQVDTQKPEGAAVAATPRGEQGQVVQAKSEPKKVRPPRKVSPPPVAAPLAEPVDDAPVELRFARFVTAMRGNDVAAAETELALLRKRLPEGSLGLVRVQAWFDLKGGRSDVALLGYQTILDRLPGDEEAAINIASIHSQRQQAEQARAVLAAATRVNPDSVPLRNALNQFSPAGRP